MQGTTVAMMPGSAVHLHDIPKYLKYEQTHISIPIYFICYSLCLLLFFFSFISYTSQLDISQFRITSNLQEKAIEIVIIHYYYHPLQSHIIPFDPDSTLFYHKPILREAKTCLLKTQHLVISLWTLPHLQHPLPPLKVDQHQREARTRQAHFNTKTVDRLPSPPRHLLQH